MSSPANPVPNLASHLTCPAESFLALRCLQAMGLLPTKLVTSLLENIKVLAAGDRGAVEWAVLAELLGWLAVNGLWRPQMAVEMGLWEGRRVQ